MLNVLICSMNMSIVAVIYLIVSRVLSNKRSPSIRYYSWVVVIIGFLIPIRLKTGSALVTIENTAATNPAVATHSVHTSATSLINPMSVITAYYLIGAVRHTYTSLFLQTMTYSSIICRTNHQA